MPLPSLLILLRLLLFLLLFCLFLRLLFRSFRLSSLPSLLFPLPSRFFLVIHFLRFLCLLRFLCSARSLLFLSFLLLFMSLPSLLLFSRRRRSSSSSFRLLSLSSLFMSLSSRLLLLFGLLLLFFSSSLGFLSLPSLFLTLSPLFIVVIVALCFRIIFGSGSFAIGMVLVMLLLRSVFTVLRQSTNQHYETRITQSPPICCDPVLLSFHSDSKQPIRNSPHNEQILSSSHFLTPYIHCRAFGLLLYP